MKKTIEKIRKTDAYKALIALNLIDTTSEKQEKNGTVRLHDYVSSCDYIFYKSGYSRRGYEIYHEDEPMYSIYQLNKVIKTTSKKNSSVLKRVLHPGNYEKLMLMAIPRVIAYREKN